MLSAVLAARPMRSAAWRVVALVMVAYAAGAVIAFVAFDATSIVVLFLSAGVTFAALVLTPRRLWPWILGTVALTEIAVDLSQGQDIRFVWGFALANTTEPLIGALLFRRYVTGPVDLLRRRDLLFFVACGVLAGPAVGGLVGATTISIGMHRNWFESLLPFWAGDAMGVLTVGGSILTWRHRGRLDRGTAGRWALALAATVVVTAVGFWPIHLPLFYLPLPLLFAFAFAGGLAITVTSGLAMTVIANLMSSAGRGPWSALDISPQLKTATLQLFLGTALLGAWFLAVGIAERDIARAATSTERAARQRLHALQSVTAQLARSATSPAIAEVIVRDGIGLVADHGMAVLASDGPEVRTWTTTGVAAEERVPEGALAEVLATGTRVVDSVHSELWVPVSDGDGRVLGALAFGFARPNAIDEDVVAVAEALANLAGEALRRAQRYERERDAAHQLQRALLPALAGGLSGVRVTAEYRPADRSHDVGGDWYDAFPLDGGRIAFAVGDVVGHDLPAAAAMARLQSALRIVAQGATGPGQVLERLDEASSVISNSLMTTVGYADYDPASGRLRYACAGHPPPLLLTSDGAEYLWDGRSVPVGVHRPARGQGECDVAAGSVLIWYTDGLVERRQRPMREGLERLASVAGTLRQHDPGTLGQELLRQMSVGHARRDDTVVLCIQFRPPSDTTRDADATRNAGAGLAANPRTNPAGALTHRAVGGRRRSASAGT